MACAHKATDGDGRCHFCGADMAALATSATLRATITDLNAARDQVNALEAENAKLRVALTEILDDANHAVRFAGCEGPSTQQVRDLAITARDALKP